MTRLLVSGAAGVLGSEYLRQLSWLAAGEFEPIPLFRTDASREQFTARHPDIDGLRSLVCDLTSPGAVESTRRSVQQSGPVVGIHIAADTSWQKSAAQLRGPNVEATRSFASLVRSCGTGSRLIYVSTAYTDPGTPQYRNGYEQTKAEGEALVRTEFADLCPTTFSCSLVIGRTSDGGISRFHGLYPLLHLLETHAPPFLVGNERNRVDLVPVDWTVEQLVQQTRVTAREGHAAPVVAAAGDHALTLAELACGLVDALNACRGSAAEPLRPMPVISFRQYAFLRRSLTAWKVQDRVKTDGMRFQDRLFGVYRPYLEDGHLLAPRGCTSLAPPLKTYLDPVVRYWYRSTRARRLDAEAGVPLP